MGKSVASASAIRHLQAEGRNTCYYFFQRQELPHKTVECFLRSLEVYVSKTPVSVYWEPVFKLLLSMQEDGVSINNYEDENAIWRKIFVNGIIKLKSTISKTQYWILDGVEEPLPWETLLMFLQELSSNFPVKVSLSPRDFPQLEKLLLRCWPRLLRHRISAAATKKGIVAYLESNAAMLPVPEDARYRMQHRLRNHLRRGDETLDDRHAGAAVGGLRDVAPGLRRALRDLVLIRAREHLREEGDLVALNRRQLRELHPGVELAHDLGVAPGDGHPVDDVAGLAGPLDVPPHAADQQ